jgi:methylmalonyl-CoA mutase cobalamin-binding subunit
MQVTIELPTAFSVRDEHEFFPMQHVMARLNPKLMVKQVATGMHVNGGCTVFWGLIYLDGHPPGKKQIEAALREAGFDFTHNVLTQAAYIWAEQTAAENGHTPPAVASKSR